LHADSWYCEDHVVYLWMYALKPVIFLATIIDLACGWRYTSLISPKSWWRQLWCPHNCLIRWHEKEDGCACAIALWSE